MDASDPPTPDGAAPGRAAEDLVAWETIRTLVGFDTTRGESNLALMGKKSWRCRVRGHEAHSSLAPCGVNAVEIGCALVGCRTQAHHPDEWVSVAQLAACEMFMCRLADRVCCAR